MNDLDEQLAVEEHRQGLGVIDGHCADCNRVVDEAYRAKCQRECDHDYTNIVNVSGKVVATYRELCLQHRHAAITS